MTNTIEQSEKINEEAINAFYESLDNNYPDDAKKIKDFVSWSKESRGFDESLTVAVIEQFDVDEFVSYAEDAANHGIMGGYGGFVWYDDTVAFYNANKDKIVQWAKDLNDSFGEGDSYLLMIANFNLMKKAEFSIDNIAEFIYSGDTELDDYTTFANNMTWGVAEEVCRFYVDFLEETDYEDEEDEENE